MNSLSNKTSLLVLLNVSLFVCSSTKSPKDDSGGTKRAEAMFYEKHKHVTSSQLARTGTHFSVMLWVILLNVHWLYFSHVKKAVQKADKTYHFFHM